MEIKHFLLILLCILLNNTKILASSHFYYFKNENKTKETLQSTLYEFNEKLLLEEKISFLIKNMLNNKNSDINYIPSDAKLINVKIKSGHLILNFNKNIKNYGGSHFELNLIKQILANCFQFKEVKTVTFLIENKLDYLPEGSLIYKKTREN